MDFKDLNKDIKNGLKNIYVFYGEERYLIEQYINLIASKIIPEGLEINKIKLDGTKTTFDYVLDNCETLPFLSDKKLVILDNMDFNNSEDKDKLLEYLKNYSEFTYLILVFDDLDAKFKKVFKADQIVKFDRLTNPYFSKWLHKKIKSHNKDINTSDLMYLINRLGYLEKNNDKSLLQVANEVQIICSVDNKFITKENIDRVIKKPLEGDIFKMLDYISEKKVDKSILLFHTLMDKGEAVQKIFFMISRQFRLLKKAKILKKAGHNKESITKILGIHPYSVKKLLLYVDKFSDSSLNDILTLCVDIELKMKTTTQDTVLAVEYLLIRSSKFR